MEKNTRKNVRSHINKAFLIIDQYLPYRYVDRVKKLCDAPEGTIRNVRSSRNGRSEIVEALLKVALEEKKIFDKMNKKTI